MELLQLLLLELPDVEVLVGLLTLVEALGVTSRLRALTTVHAGKTSNAGGGETADGKHFLTNYSYSVVRLTKRRNGFVYWATRTEGLLFGKGVGRVRQRSLS